MAKPIAVDIDGTLSRPDRSIDPRIIDALAAWPGPVAIATGKALPYPVALAQYVGIDPIVVAENGGVAVAKTRCRSTEIEQRRTKSPPNTKLQDTSWDSVNPDLANRWRETEVVISREQPLEPLEAIARSHGLKVVDSEYAYHVKSPDVGKGQAFVSIAEHLGFDPQTVVAIGDSPNDISLFEVVGTSFAVANATDDAKAAADSVTSGAYADGFLEALNELL